MTNGGLWVMGAARIASPVSGGVMEVVWGARTDRGLVRELNEDAYLTEPPVFLVADGMGGHRSGKTASAAVIEEFQAATAGHGDVQVTPEWVTERRGGAHTPDPRRRRWWHHGCRCRTGGPRRAAVLAGLQQR